MERWLSFKVQDAIPSKTNSLKARVLISVPKRIVGQATQRNRLKRVLREALRLGPALKIGKVYYIKVTAQPRLATLGAAQEALKGLHAE